MGGIMLRGHGAALSGNQLSIALYGGFFVPAMPSCRLADGHYSGIARGGAIGCADADQGKKRT
jgi:hypothetical protein